MTEGNQGFKGAGRDAGQAEGALADAGCGQAEGALADAGCGQAVDMLAEAREAQWSALAFLGEEAIKVVAPAKVNLFLGVGERRADGYHEVLNVMHALALHDSIYMTCRDVDGGAGEGALAVDAGEGALAAEAADAAAAAGADAAAATADANQAAQRNAAFAGPEGNLLVKVEVADKTQMLAAPGAKGAIDVPVADNLAFKAIDALAREIGMRRPQAVDVRIEKHIPMQAGLGGGSSDAAAVLAGMAHFWGVADDGPTLARVAARLGADVAFFLQGGCGLLTGVGDAFERHLQPMKHALVLVKPDAGVPTAACYAAFDAAACADADSAAVPAELAARVEDASAASEVPLFNNLAPAACSLLPELAEVAAWLAAQQGVTPAPDGSPLVLLSGSGSATFAVTESYAHAARIAGEANARGWWARATSFSSLRALKA